MESVVRGFVDSVANKDWTRFTGFFLGAAEFVAQMPDGRTFCSVPEFLKSQQPYFSCAAKPISQSIESIIPINDTSFKACIRVKAEREVIATVFFVKQNFLGWKIHMITNRKVAP